MEYTFSLQSEAATALMTATSSAIHSQVDTRVAFYVEPATVGVAISSSIETSWKKFTGAASALADAYKPRDANGNLTNTPNGKAVLVGPNPTDASKNIWKIACLRGEDGTMSVQSAPIWSGVDYEWRAGATFRSSVAGVVSPQYKWTLSGGNAVMGGNFGIQPGPSGFYEVIGLGTSKDSLSPGSSTITLDVVDMNPGSPSNTLTDTYNIKWHLPVDDETKVASYPRLTHELRSPDEFRENDVSFEVGGHLDAKFKMGTLWYLQDFITGFGKGFRGATEALEGNEKKAFLLDKIGELIETYDLGAEQSTDCPFTSAVYTRSQEFWTLSICSYLGSKSQHDFCP